MAKTVIRWMPKEDITTYELALCLQVLIADNAYGAEFCHAVYETLPDECKRHWEKVEE